MITDGSSSYSIFIYNCENVGDADDAVVGFNAGGNLFDNYEFSSAHDLTCRDRDREGFSNIIYLLGVTGMLVSLFLLCNIQLHILCMLS